MRAIDILFDEIDKLNAQIKIEENVQKKVFLAFQISKVIEIINEIEKFRIQITNDRWL